MRGLRCHASDVRLQILNNDYDIIIFTETWLNNTIFDAEIFDPRYTVHRRDREYTGRGGGILIAVSNRISSQRKPEWGSECEDLWISLVLNLGNRLVTVKICVVYLPPPVNLTKLETFIDNTNRILEEHTTY